MIAAIDAAPSSKPTSPRRHRSPHDRQWSVLWNHPMKNACRPPHHGHARRALGTASVADSAGSRSQATATALRPLRPSGDRRARPVSSGIGPWPANLPDSPGAAFAGRDPADHLDGAVRRLDQRVVVPAGRVHAVGRHRTGPRDPRRQGDPRADRDDRRQRHGTRDRPVADRAQGVHPGHRHGIPPAPRSWPTSSARPTQRLIGEHAEPGADRRRSTRCRSSATNGSARCHRSRCPSRRPARCR